jgi:ribose 5-phosphate isomerase B
MRIVLGADHAGYLLKDAVKQHLAARGIEVLDVGTEGPASVDYPDFAHKACEQVLEGKADLAVLVCGTGIGMSLTANKIHGIRAAVGNTEFEARLAREHNNANVLALGARVIDGPAACRSVDAWLDAAFAGGRHQQRLDKVAAIEREE